MKKSRFPHYKSELATGCGQLDIRYFDNKVLEHYLAHPEKYIVNENPFGMGQHHAAFKDVPKRQWNKVWGAVKCPGVRQLANGGRAICMTLRYLSQMPRDEQVHWAQFELPPEQCHFLPDSVDEVFTKWYYGRVRSKPAWEGTSHEDDDHDD